MTGGDHYHCSTRVAGEAALAHIVKDKTEAAHRRSDLFERRRELMVTWAAFVAAGTAEAITLRELANAAQHVLSAAATPFRSRK
jgi:hypothetical protein